MGFDKNAYDNQYCREHYDRMTFNVAKGGRDVLKQLAKDRTDGNITALVLDALKLAYGVDLRG